MTFLVTGATGKAGRHVVDSLLAEGRRVRALTRTPGKAALPPQVEVVKGDLTDPASLRGALSGVVGAHLLTTGGDDYATLSTGPQLAGLFAEAGVRRVALLWNGQAGPVEEAFAAGPVEWTRLEATDFMGNTLQWLPQIEEGRVEEVFGDVPVAVVHEADVGAVSARVLIDGGHAGRSYTITGPVALTARERLAVVGDALGRPLEFAEIGEVRARERWRAAGHGAELIEVLAAWHRTPHPATPVVRELLGREPAPFEEWVRDRFAQTSR